MSCCTHCLFLELLSELKKYQREDCNELLVAFTGFSSVWVWAPNELHAPPRLPLSLITSTPTPIFKSLSPDLRFSHPHILQNIKDGDIVATVAESWNITDNFTLVEESFETERQNFARLRPFLGKIYWAIQNWKQLVQLINLIHLTYFMACACLSIYSRCQLISESIIMSITVLTRYWSIFLHRCQYGLANYKIVKLWCVSSLFLCVWTPLLLSRHHVYPIWTVHIRVNFLLWTFWRKRQKLKL